MFTFVCFLPVVKQINIPNYNSCTITHTVLILVLLIIYCYLIERRVPTLGFSTLPRNCLWLENGNVWENWHTILNIGSFSHSSRNHQTSKVQNLQYEYTLSFSVLYVNIHTSTTSLSFHISLSNSSAYHLSEERLSDTVRMGTAAEREPVLSCNNTHVHDSHNRAQHAWC